MHFKVILGKYIKKKINELKNKCFPYYSKNTVNEGMKLPLFCPKKQTVATIYHRYVNISMNFFRKNRVSLYLMGRLNP